MEVRMTGREDQKENDLFFLCSLIEYIGRKTSMQNSTIRLLYGILLIMATSVAKAQYVQQEEFSESNRVIAVEEVNLMENGGLEEWIPLTSLDMPKGWFCHNNTNVKKEKKIVCEGKFSAKMQAEKGSTARIDQRIAVSPGQKIRIRFSYYVEQWKSQGARTYCYFRTDAAEKYNISSDELQAFYGNDQYHIIRGGGYGKTYLPHDLNVWQTFDEMVEVPPTAHYFVFGVNSYYGTTIYVDDCWVTDATETTIKGDVNGDHEVDVADISLVVNTIINPDDIISTTSADANGDGVVNIADIVTIISEITNQR